MTTSPTIDLLLKHQGFLTSLARSLVDDLTEAEDLAQDTWIAALLNPPTAAGPLPNWLRRIMHNRLRNTHRNRMRREAREQAVACDATDQRSHLIHERLEAQQRVVDAVLALPTGPRQIVLLRYYDGLSSAEIARRKSLPAATVRSQLQRALAEVRARLDEGPGGRPAWCALFGPWVRTLEQRPSSVGAPLLATVAVATLGIALITAFALADAWTIEAAPGTVATAILVPTALGTVPATPTIGQALVPEPHRESLVVRNTVPIHCVDLAGKPVVAAELWLFQAVRLPDASREFRRVGPLTTDEQGKSGHAVALTYGGRRFDRFVYARVRGRLVGVGRGIGSTPTQGGTTPAIRVVMCPSRTVTGHITVPDGIDPASVEAQLMGFNTHDGKQIINMFSRSFLGHDHLRGLFTTRLDARARFSFGDLPATGHVYLQADGPSLGRVQYNNAARVPTPIPEIVELRMVAEGILAGQVLTAEGEPRRDCIVKTGRSARPSFESRTDDHGRFRICGLMKGSFDVFVDSGDPNLVLRPRTVAITSGRTTEAKLTLEVGVLVSGRVIDATNGAGIEKASVIAIVPRQFNGNPRLGYSVSRHDGSFLFRLPRGRAQLYFGNVPVGYVYPEPQIVNDLKIEDAPIRDLRLTLNRN